MLQLAVDEKFSAYGEDYSWDATHNFDSQARTDTVNLTVIWQKKYATASRSCRIVYQYDRTSDTWTVYSKGAWSDSSYQFNNELLGTWEQTYAIGDSYSIHITAVNSNSVTVNGEVTIMANSGVLSVEPCTISFSGTYPIDSYDGGRLVKVAISSSDIPEGFVLDNDGDPAEICIYLNEDKGVEDVFGFELKYE